ncbi:MGDG synthase family glycosyltransferase [Clostridium isatidis]|uniref:Galactosyldiacylglycerol synthase n=1 Tax=Clostridium isatidis TaxID=182773 RepID=A0A343JEW4_9CLOT|nr:glycosyltransferase [Clostridium isatidis]ASW44072.1 galactosyldiacylglycerol synthase [Clostridium isatidis]
MKKVLILTTSTGEGHNQAANSIANTFMKYSYEVITYDFLKSNSKILTNLLVKGYEIAASFFPKTYGFLYNISNTLFITKIISFIFYFLNKKVYKFIRNSNPDVIVVTHPFAVSIATNIKNKINIPIITIVTDFKAHGAYISDKVDAYIVGSNETKNNLIEKGILKDRIFVYGIPVKDKFFKEKIYLSGIDKGDYFNVLLMGGSMGLKNISQVLKELLNNSCKLRITVVCGKNEELRNNLLKKYNNNIKNKKLHILGFSNDIDVLMDYSDLIISKPGGLTSTEAINKRLPLIIPFVIPGQETENVEVLQANGCAIYLNNLLELNLLVSDLINNPDKLKKIEENMANLSSSYSKDNIVKLADKLIQASASNSQFIIKTEFNDNINSKL